MRFLSRDVCVSGLAVAITCALMLAAAAPICAEQVVGKGDAWPWGQPSLQVLSGYEAHFESGQELMQSGNLEAAAREFLQAADVLGVKPVVYETVVFNRKYDTYHRDREWRRKYAAPLATQCVNLGHALRQTGRLDTALSLYHVAVGLNPVYTSALYSCGRAYTEKAQGMAAMALEQDKRIGDPKVCKSQTELYRVSVEYLHAARELEPENADIRVALSDALRAWGLVDSSLKHAKMATELDPKNPQAFLALGQSAQACGDLDASVTAYRKAASLASTEPDAFQAMVQHDLGKALAADGKFDDAVTAYRKATLLAPTTPVYQNSLGTGLRLAGKPAESAGAHAAASVLDPDTPEYYLNLAASARESGDLTGAVVAYRKAMRLYPDESRLHHQLGLTLRERGDMNTVITKFAAMTAGEITDDEIEVCLASIAMHFISDSRLRRIDAMDPRSYEVIPRMVLKGDRWSQLRRQLVAQWKVLDEHALFGTARLDLQDVIIDYPAIEPALLRRAAAYERVLSVQMSGQLAVLPADLPAYLVRNARADSPMASSAQVLAPEVKRSIIGVALVLQQYDDVRESLAEIDWAWSLDRKNPYLLNDLGEGYMLLGNVDRALTMFSRATRIADDIAKFHYNGGCALALKGRYSDAMDAWRRAEKLGMNDPQLFNRMGLIYLQQTELDYAYAMFAKAVEVDKDFGPAHYYLGLVQALQQSASPLSASAVEISRLRNDLGRKHYDVRGEFITEENLQAAIASLTKADTADADRHEHYYYTAVELALQDPMLSSLEGADVIHCVAAGKDCVNDWAAVTNNVAVVAAMQGKLDVAENLLRTAVRDEPYYALAQWNLGRVLMLRKKDGEATEVLGKATRLARLQGLPFFMQTRTVSKPVAMARLPRVAAEEDSTKTLLEAFDIPEPVL